MACRNHVATVEIPEFISTSNSPQPDPAPLSAPAADVQLVADPNELPSEEIVSAWSADPRCVECGHVEEFYDPDIEKRQTEVARSRGFQLHEHSLALYADCVKKDCPYRSPA